MPDLILDSIFLNESDPTRKKRMMFDPDDLLVVTEQDPPEEGKPPAIQLWFRNGTHATIPDRNGDLLDIIHNARKGIFPQEDE